MSNALNVTSGDIIRGILVQGCNIVQEMQQGLIPRMREITRGPNRIMAIEVEVEQEEELHG